MRIDYSDDETFAGQFELWQANCRRSLRGRKGQSALRDLEAALLTLPEKRLIRDVLVDDDGGMCAVGCYAKHKGLDLAKFDPECESDRVGIQAGMPRLVAWKVVALNDIELGTPFDLTPEERYERVLAWVREQLR